jgi:NAD-dependent deacetylase
VSGNFGARQVTEFMSQIRSKREKIVVLSGAGISAPSGLATFRDSNGLWKQYRFTEVASPEGWERHPEVVLEFYNERRAKACAATPNAGHRAIANLERRFDVTVITQNVDDLHERAGSSRIIHLHGELTKARSTADPDLVYDIGCAPIRIGDRCGKGSQLRPHIVWFGENVERYDDARFQMMDADRVLVVGTSLTVYPAAELVEFALDRATKLLIDVEPVGAPSSFRTIRGSADQVLPSLVEAWLGE